jgi:glycosyltransferase involved in cell wall biosynthesis
MEHLPFFRTAFKRFCYSKSDLIVATCDEVRDFLANDLGIAPDRISVIPTCVRLDTYMNRPYSQRENAVLHMGTVDYKNPLSTLNAFAQTPASDARLYITGKATPELKAAISALPKGVRDRVELPGYVSSARLIELLGTVKVVSVPSNYVAPVASPTVIEALAAGTPVVASTSISKFVLRDGENGYIRPSSEPAAMAQAYQTLLHDRSVWERLSANAAASANMFSAGHVADLYLRLGSGQDRVGQAVRQSLSSTAL